MAEDIVIRKLCEEDIEKLAHTFTAPWSTFEATLKLWQLNFKEQQEGIRTVCLLESQNEFLGYGSLLRVAENPNFKERGIPEINALWIDEQSRKQGLATRLIGHLENMAQEEEYKTLGIGVGLYKDDGPAQRLYVKLGYVPDGKEITYKGVSVLPGEQYPMDDHLIFWFTKTVD